MTLLTRTRRHVALTAPGRVLYDEATRLIAHANRVASVMTGARTGRFGQLFLGCVPSGLFGVLPRILNGDDASFEIRVTEAYTAEVVAAVVDGCLDCGLVFDWSEASIVCTDCHEELDAVVAAFDQRCPECHLEVCPYCRATLSDENPFPFWEPHEAPL